MNIGNIPDGEEFFRRSRQIFSGIPGVFQENLTRNSGTKPPFGRVDNVQARPKSLLKEAEQPPVKSAGAICAGEAPQAHFVRPCRLPIKKAAPYGTDRLCPRPAAAAAAAGVGVGSKKEREEELVSLLPDGIYHTTAVEKVVTKL